LVEVRMMVIPGAKLGASVLQHGGGGSVASAKQVASQPAGRQPTL
jgi:hypothetical protein